MHLYSTKGYILCTNAALSSMGMCLGRVFEGNALEILAIDTEYLKGT